ncbi:MAG TPA: hypothetical protein VD973_29685 [Symbiobacteriaceae bacterium]|nr:hypothetical protein [Symbiobacteriaceae bacterium]
MRHTLDAAGLKVEAAAYTLSFPSDRPFAMLDDAAGQRWAELFLGSSLHTAEGLDATARLSAPVVEEEGDALRITVLADSTVWQQKELVFLCRNESIQAFVRVQGKGRLTDVNLFGGYYSGHLRWGSGFFQSGLRFKSVFNPEPWGSEQRALPAVQSTLIDVMGTSVPGKGHWFFTPPPFVYAASLNAPLGTVSRVQGGSMGADQGGTPLEGGSPDSEAVAQRPLEGGNNLPEGPWMTMGLAVKPGEHNFTIFHYDAIEYAFSFRLAYEGQTAVDGAFESPAVLFQFGAADPYVGIERYVSALEELGLVKQPDTSNRPQWWSDPIQCGWGAQCHLSNLAKGRAPDFCTQENYDKFISALEANGLNPGILVLDDKWSATYGTCEVDTQKWPDLRGWIDREHGKGRKVLLWWKAWDAEGLPAEECVRNIAGQGITADPSNPAYEASLRKAVRLMLSKEGYDADGFKVDFSARTPSGPGLTRHGKEWGVELLYKLIWILNDEAKKVKADALVMTHCPNPYFANVTDMIRLNDINGGTPVIPQMIHRAKVAKAACPTLLIDTDNWPMPSRAQWREYLEIQNDLGIPSLYFATDLDCMEPLEERDYKRIAEVWAEARARGGR